MSVYHRFFFSLCMIISFDGSGAGRAFNARVPAPYWLNLGAAAGQNIKSYYYRYIDPGADIFDVPIFPITFN